MGPYLWAHIRNLRPNTKILIAFLLLKVKAKTLILFCVLRLSFPSTEENGKPLIPTSLSSRFCAFKRYVEIGRVALVNFGKDYGKLVVIVDVVDQNRALVDAPDMERIQMNLKRLSLTDIVIDINRVPKKKILIEAMEKADVKNKWEKSSRG
ncbi:unnamed protein product [Brassica napus]|uniref:(rape) hypothetical protein n=1 Tax=Brassica napus TaxID=3708 RepID=A0A816Y6X1_BRANA|nr:unnamed protein product [Brassica napus]